MDRSQSSPTERPTAVPTARTAALDLLTTRPESAENLRLMRRLDEL